MKEIQEPLAAPTEQVIEITDQDQIKKQTKFLGSWRLHPGHKCWKVNRETGECSEAEYEVETVEYNDAEKGQISLRKKLIVDEAFVYTCALNKRNAIRNLNKLGYNFPDPKQLAFSKKINDSILI